MSPASLACVSGRSVESQPVILFELLLSGALIAVTMGIHGVGMYLVVRVARHIVQAEQRAHHAVRIGQVLSVVVVLSLAVIFFDIVVWAGAFAAMGLIPDPRLAFHFAALTYTTLGASTSLPAQWLLLEAACAIAGTFTFAWTTAVLLQILNRVLDWHNV